MGNSFPPFSLLVSLFALGILLAPSAWAEQLLTDPLAAETSTNQGKYLKIIFSADDEVCRKLLRIYDEGFVDRPDMVDGKFVYPLGKMTIHNAQRHHAIRHDDDPMFIRWQPFEHRFTDESYAELAQWAEFDIDNDGVTERVMRTTLSHKEQWLTEGLTISNGLTRKQLTSYQGALLSLIKLMDWGIGSPIGHGDGPLPHYPGLTEEDKGGGRAWEKGCPHKSCPIYSSPTYIVPFRVKDVTYLSFFHSVLNRPGYGIWGVVQRLKSKDSADDICYFDLNDSFKTRVFGE